MNTFTKTALVAVALSAAILAETHIASASSTGQIVGRVTDGSTHAGVAGASVAAMSTTGTYRVVTDRNGFYTIVEAFPNVYLLSVSADNYETTQTLGGSVNPEQATLVNIQIDKSLADVLSALPSNPLSIFRPNLASEQFVLTSSATDATNGSGGSYGLYQATGIAGTLPGVTLDSGVNIHIRGSRLDEVGFEYDGVNATEPLTGLTATNLVQDGIVRFELNESGGFSSAATGAAGTVNTVISQGSYPAHGSVTMLLQSPTFYHGINFDYGSATPDNRFSWFVSGILWNSGYDWGNRGSFVPGAETTATAAGDAPLGDVTPSRDQVINVHYRPSSSGVDDIQFLASNGFERFNNALRPLYWPSTNPLYGASTSPTPVNGLCNNNNLALFPGQNNCTAGLGGASDHVDQGYSIDKIQYTHQIRSNSSIAVRFANVISTVNGVFPFGDGPFADLWQNRQSNQQQLGAEFSAQLGSNDFLRTGIDQIYSANDMRSIFVSSGFGVVTPTNNLDRSYWLTDTFRPNARMSVDMSGRSVSRTYYRVAAPAFTDSGAEGQLGASYVLDSKTALRASYGNHAELPFVSRVERILTKAPNFGDISASNQIQLLEGQPGVAQSHTYDASIERTLSNGTTLKITPFWRRSSDLLAGYGGQQELPQAVDPYYVNGLDAEVQFLRAGAGVTGYIDYTHTRAIAGATGDFNQPIGLGAVAAHALFPVSFIAPDVANVVLTWHKQKWTINPVLSYSGGYPYGVGRFTYNDLNCPASTSSSSGDPARPCGAVILNPAAFSNSKLVDPGESRFADGRVCCSALTANLNLSYRLTESATVGLQWENLNHAYGALALTQNPYFPNSAYGAPGFNGYFNYGTAPYIPSTLNTSEEFLFTITQKT